MTVILTCESTVTNATEKKLPCPLQLAAAWIMDSHIASGVTKAMGLNMVSSGRVDRGHQHGLWLQHKDHRHYCTAYSFVEVALQTTEYHGVFFVQTALHANTH